MRYDDGKLIIKENVYIYIYMSTFGSEGQK